MFWDSIEVSDKMNYEIFKTIDKLCDRIPDSPHKQLKDIAIRFGVYQKIKPLTKEK